MAVGERTRIKQNNVSDKKNNLKMNVKNNMCFREMSTIIIKWFKNVTNNMLYNKLPNFRFTRTLSKMGRSRRSSGNSYNDRPKGKEDDSSKDEEEKEGEDKSKQEEKKTSKKKTPTTPETQPRQNPPRQAKAKPRDGLMEGADKEKSSKDDSEPVKKITGGGILSGCEGKDLLGKLKVYLNKKGIDPNNSNQTQEKEKFEKATKVL